MVKIIDVPKGKIIRGEEILSAAEDLGYYEKKTNSGISIAPTTPYCPACSATHEYNYGKIRRKWNLFHGDLNFKLSYREDRDGNLYARGSSDMKGQVMASIFAIEAVAEQGALPYNIKFMLEGEEEHT